MHKEHLQMLNIGKLALSLSDSLGKGAVIVPTIFTSTDVLRANKSEVEELLDMFESRRDDSFIVSLKTVKFSDVYETYFSILD
jgi:hypothetical protein